MPTYQFKNKKTGELSEAQMKIAEKEDFMKANPDLESYHGNLAIGYRVTTKRPDENFLDILRESKKHHRGNDGGSSFI